MLATPARKWFSTYKLHVLLRFVSESVLAQAAMTLLILLFRFLERWRLHCPGAGFLAWVLLLWVPGGASCMPLTFCVGFMTWLLLPIRQCCHSHKNEYTSISLAWYGGEASSLDLWDFPCWRWEVHYCGEYDFCFDAFMFCLNVLIFFLGVFRVYPCCLDVPVSVLVAKCRGHGV